MTQTEKDLLELEELNEVIDETGDYWTSTPNAVLYDGIHLSFGARFVYMFIKSFANQHSKIAFPSQELALQILGISKPTYIKYIAELEEVKLLEVRRERKADGTNKVNQYILLAIPEEIKKGSTLSMTLKNKDKVEKAKKEFKKKKGIEEHGLKGKKKAIKEVPEEDKLKLLADLKTYEKKANMAVIEAIIAANQFNFVVAVVAGKKKAPVRKDTYLAILSRFCFEFNAFPSEDEFARLIELNNTYSRKALINSINKENSVFSEEFEAAVAKRNEVNETVKQKFAQNNFEQNNGKSNYKKEDTFKQTKMFSDYDNNDMASRFL